MKNVLIIALFAVFVLLTGATMQGYSQAVAKDGSSVITKTFDAAALGSSAPAVQKACAENASLNCQVENGKMQVSITVPKTNPYYQLKADYGLPYISYTMTINAIPDDLFSAQLNQILAAAGAPKGGTYDASDLKKNTETASLLKQLGDTGYNVQMPGEVTETNFGQKTAITFLLSDVYAQGGPIIIKAQELNFSYIILILMIVTIAGFAAWFLFRKKEAVYVPKAAPKEQKKRKK
ncbi:MAG: hypothetical protein V1492_02925 [Candidatus Micrarchaeota archaeon]